MCQRLRGWYRRLLSAISHHLPHFWLALVYTPLLFMLTLPLFWRMLRPEFLTATFCACLIGWASAHASGMPWHWGFIAATAVLALALHAAANVLNDAEDAISGADAANTQAITPFTGGAGFIQRGQISLATTQRVAWGLLGFVVLGGLLLAYVLGPQLLLYGLLGCFLAWAYSAPPLRLMNRGLGELAVAAAWAAMAAGSDFVLRGSPAWQPLLLGASFALLMANVLLINGLPDAASDAAVGKHTLAVRLGPRVAPWAYLGMAAAAHVWAGLALWCVGAGAWALLPLLTLPLCVAATRILFQAQGQIPPIKPAIVLTISAAMLHAILVALGLVLV